MAGRQPVIFANLQGARCTGSPGTLPVRKWRPCLDLFRSSRVRFGGAQNGLRPFNLHDGKKEIDQVNLIDLKLITDFSQFFVGINNLLF